MTPRPGPGVTGDAVTARAGAAGGAGGTNEHGHNGSDGYVYLTLT